MWIKRVRQDLRDEDDSLFVDRWLLLDSYRFISFYMIHKELTELVIGAAFTVHNTLGPGFLEKVYENELVVELQQLGLFVEAQVPIPVTYKGVPVGDFVADLFVESCLLIELKAVEQIHPKHEAQLVNYLTATGIDIGLLINFGSSVSVKRKYRVRSST